MPAQFILLLAVVYAHNWLHGKRSGRAGGRASQILPAPPRAGPRQPHRNVGIGQDFILEWSSGHSNTFFWFTVIKATDEDKVASHTDAVLTDYVTSAPDSAYIYTDPRYERTHVSCSHKYPEAPDGRDDCAQTDWNNGEGYERNLTASDPEFVDRTPIDPNPISDSVHFKYSDDDREYDRRVAYHNPNYPWIEAVHRFRVNSYGVPREWDSTMISIPARQGSGEYMVHMQWNGYADVIDVDVLPEDAVDIYGAPSTDISWIKTEHCQYSNYDDYNNLCVVLQPGDNVDSCLEECVGRGPDRCLAANVVPLYNPPEVKIRGHTIEDSNIPWAENDGSSRCSKNLVTADADENTMVCYGFFPATPTDPTFNPETESMWYIRKNDPEDPIFYSTCYRQDFKMVFTGNVACPLCESEPVEEIQGWKIGYECLACSDVAEMRELNIPKFWKLADTCEQCT